MVLGPLILMALACAWWLLALLLALRPEAVTVPEPDPPAWMLREIYDDTR